MPPNEATPTGTTGKLPNPKSEPLQTNHSGAKRVQSPELLPPKVAAHYLSVSVWTLARWRQHRIGPDFISYPSSASKRQRYFYEQSNLDAFLARRTRHASTNQLGSRS
jgi:hypothetical protein